MLHAGHHPGPPMTRDQSLVGSPLLDFLFEAQQAGSAQLCSAGPCLSLCLSVPLSLFCLVPNRNLARDNVPLGIMPRTHSYTFTHLDAQRGDEDRTGSTGDRPRDVTLPSAF